MCPFSLSRSPAIVQTQESLLYSRQFLGLARTVQLIADNWYHLYQLLLLLILSFALSVMSTSVFSQGWPGEAVLHRGHGVLPVSLQARREEQKVLMDSLSPPDRPPCRGSLCPPPRRHSCRARPSHWGRCLMSSIETRSSASLETRDMRHLPEGQAHRGGLLYLLPCVGLGREDVTFLPTTRLHHLLPVDDLSRDSHSQRLTSLLVR